MQVIGDEQQKHFSISEIRTILEKSAGMPLYIEAIVEFLNNKGVGGADGQGGHKGSEKSTMDMHEATLGMLSFEQVRGYPTRSWRRTIY